MGLIALVFWSWVAYYSTRAFLRWLKKHAATVGKEDRLHEYITGNYLDVIGCSLSGPTTSEAGALVKCELNHVYGTGSPWPCSGDETFKLTVKDTNTYATVHVSEVVTIKGSLRIISFTIFKTGLYSIKCELNGRAVKNQITLKVNPGPPSLVKTVLKEPVHVCQASEQFAAVLQFYDQHNNRSSVCDTKDVTVKVLLIGKGSHEVKWDGMGMQTVGDNLHIDAISLLSGMFVMRISLGDPAVKTLVANVIVLSKKTHKKYMELSSAPKLDKYWSAQLWKNNKWRKGWVFITPSQVYVKESWGLIFASKIWSARLTVNTQVLVLPSTVRETVALGSLAQIASELMENEEGCMVLDDRIRQAMVLKCNSNDRDLFMALFARSCSLRTTGAAKRAIANFADKHNAFMSQIKLSIAIRRLSVTRGVGMGFCEHLYSLFKGFDDKEWLKQWKISFTGEDAIDLGGVGKDFMTHSITHLFSDETGLFQAQESSSLYHIAYPHPSGKDHLYKLAGSFMAKTLIESKRMGVYSPVRLSFALRSSLLGLSVTHACFEVDDPILFNQKIKYMLDNNVDDLEEAFVDLDADHKEVPLCPGGEDMLVTEENKHDYLLKLAQHRFVGRVQKPLESFLEGFYRVVGDEEVSLFNESELELALCGLMDIDISDLQRHSRVSDFVPKTTKQWLFSVLSQLSREQKAKFLQFMTGSSSVPVGGCVHFSPRLEFTHMAGKVDCLPEAHTCFNQLVVPTYTSFEKCREMVLIAITDGYTGFAML